MSRSAGLARAAAAVAAGVATGLGQAPHDWWPLVIPGVAALTLLVADRRPRSAAGLGYLYGLGLFIATISWVYVVAWPAAPVLIAFMSCWFLLAGWGIRTVQALPGAPFWAACVWSAVEVGSAHVPLGGFGWIRLAWTAVDTPLAGDLRWIGVTGVSLLLALTGQLLAAAVRRGGGVRPRVAAGVALVVLLGAGSGVGEWTTHRPDPAADGPRVTVIQGGVDGTAGSYAMGYARSVTDNHLSETIAAVAHQRATGAPAPDMLLWPENSTDIDPVLDAQTHDLVTTAIAVAQRPVLVGAVTEGPGPDERQTTAQWWPAGSAGPTADYHKRNLVPFGEWVPWRKQLLPILPILEHVGRQSVPGTAPGVLDVEVAGHRIAIGDVICFELAYDSTVYDTVRNGAQVVMVQSNNATYTHTGQPYQQWQMTRARAIESGRQIVVSTTSSLSGLIEPSGRVADRTREATHDFRSYDVALGHGVSAGVRASPLIGWGSCVLAAAAVAAALLVRRRTGARGDRATR